MKQGWNSLKEAVNYIKDPVNKNKPFSILVLEVGKIIIAGITAGGAIVMGELIEKGLMAIPIFAFEIPMLGSLANLLGIFLGALVSGIIGAIALNLIDQMIAKQQRLHNQQQQIEKNNEVLVTQRQLIEIKQVQLESRRMQAISSIQERHSEFATEMRESIEHIVQNGKEAIIQKDDKTVSADVSDNNKLLDQIFTNLQMS